MQVISIIPKTAEEDQQYILQATEGELDKISGIAEVEHIAGRIKVGHEIVVSAVYDKLDHFAKNQNKLKKAKAALIEMADSIDSILPAEAPK